ncbi:MAG: homoserine O-acetyltransferase MetX [Planctomycetota bacterium]|jgi:homoserine O-acetyltransferase
MSEKGSVGIVETKHWRFAEPPDQLVLRSGVKLGPIDVTYETYGELTPQRDNAILICHALSGDAHVAGRHASGNSPPWWDIMVGPGKGIDTSKYFVICSNCIGGCKGSTGPSSVNPETGRPYGLDFPMVTISDMVKVQHALLEERLGLETLLSVVGGSMGGMQVLQWAIDYPEMVVSAIPVATTSRLDAQGIAFDEVGRQAIYSDPNWRNGDYYGSEPPNRGLAVARMVGHITYLSEHSMRQRFGRSLQDKDEVGYDFGPPDFQVESYLRHKGGTFVERFDANTYLYITKAMDYFDPAADHGSLVDAFKGLHSRFLVVSYSGDWLFPTYQSKEIVRALQANGVPTTFCELESEYGHDAFLLNDEQLEQAICGFLDNAYRAARRPRDAASPANR